MGKERGRDTINPIIAYVRGEPLDSEARVGLDRQAAAGELPTLQATMDRVDEQLALSAELAAIRRSNARLEPSPTLRDSLGRHARSHPRGTRHVRASRWLRAAVVVMAAAGLAWWGTSRIERGVTELPPALVAVDPAPDRLAGFIRVGFAGNPEGPQAYTVVRARLGRMGLVNAGLLMPSPAANEFVDADLLLGIDGTVVGVRFIGHDLIEYGPIEHRRRDTGTATGQLPSEDSI